jgi:hypothetical protein
MDDAQIAALVEQWRKQLDKQMTEMKLRQWCVEKAIEAGHGPIDVVAADLLKFVSAPFSEVFKDSESPTNPSQPPDWRESPQP